MSIAADSYVSARIDTKERAADARRFPFEVKAPNATILYDMSF
jgi:hypothetical protein